MAIPGIVIVLAMVTVLRIVTVTMTLELEQLTAVKNRGQNFGLTCSWRGGGRGTKEYW